MEIADFASCFRYLRGVTLRAILCSYNSRKRQTMATHTSQSKQTSSEAPAPEVLKPQADTTTPINNEVQVSHLRKSLTPTPVRSRRGTYRPSHKATFIGLSVVVAILVVNAIIILSVVRGQDRASAETNQGEVIISSAVLDTLGVSRTPIGNAGTELIVGPNSRFNGKLTVGSDVSIAGTLRLNSKFSASDASLTKLEAGDTAVSQLNVNGDATVSNLNLRRDLAVVGATRLQGPVTIGQLLTVNNSVNVAGNLAVGGILSARNFQASSLTSDTTLTIGGHIITRGPAPAASPGSALGNNGTISISGSDAAGTVAVNIGTGGGNGILANVSFRSAYGTTPRVVVTGVGRGMGGVYVNRNATGFSIGVDGSVAPGGYAVDYIVMQ